MKVKPREYELANAPVCPGCGRGAFVDEGANFCTNGSCEVGKFEVRILTKDE